MRRVARSGNVHPRFACNGRAAGFAEECERQSRLAAAAESQDGALAQSLDDALADIEGWE